ncbi:uncharacterized protein LOC133791831 [Humulus lupulus]|uniref:uncharacterized protein LOC133791831 n=1 Tax=Humulus lupulus TaxID=3486 RepID=UPI002B40138F|nr:uncharacterized protein LOC133791831 [Humulus lupulus]
MFQVDIRKCTSQMIHLEVKAGRRQEGFFLTFVYAFNDANGRTLLWRDLKDLASRIRQPWVVLGDFNDILATEERVGNRTQGGGTLAFKECIVECKLADVKYLGCFFTWNNKQDKNSRIYSKLDRVMANQEWFIKYEFAEVLFLPEGNLDHSPAVLTVYLEVRGGVRPFKFFRMRQFASDYKQKVQASWDQPCTGVAMFKLVQKLKRLKSVLRDINKKEFGNISVVDTLAFQKLLRQQQNLQDDPLNAQLIKHEELARQEYSHIHKSYISFLHQKSKLDWLQKGDENTQLFHSSIRARRIRNRVYTIQDMNGNWVEHLGEVAKAFLIYYQQLLGSKLEGRRRVQPNIIRTGPVLTEAKAKLLVTLIYS